MKKGFDLTWLPLNGAKPRARQIPLQINFGGPEEARTLNLLYAIEARYQLRHGPFLFWSVFYQRCETKKNRSLGGPAASWQIHGSHVHVCCEAEYGDWGNFRGYLEFSLGKGQTEGEEGARGDRGVDAVRAAGGDEMHQHLGVGVAAIRHDYFVPFELFEAQVVERSRVPVDIPTFRFAQKLRDETEIDILADN